MDIEKFLLLLMLLGSIIAVRGAVGKDETRYGFGFLTVLFSGIFWVFGS